MSGVGGGFKFKLKYKKHTLRTEHLDAPAAVAPVGHKQAQARDQGQGEHLDFLVSECASACVRRVCVLSPPPCSPVAPLCHP